MKKTICLVALIILAIVSFAQISNDIRAYYPDGKRINFRFNTIRNLLDTLDIKENTSYSHPLGEIYFKRLSNTPVFVLFIDKEYPLKIKEMINSYPYSKYLNSYDYYWDLNDMIKSGALTKSYLIDIFKEPDSQIQENDGSVEWIYKNYNAKITFVGDIAKSADVINYKALLRNELSIPTFEVTGSEYTIGFNISLTNYSKKTIKYAFITVTATNPVDDRVGTKIVKGVGPILQYETGSFEFKDIIYSRVAKYLTIDNIKLQFMDGSSKIIPKTEVQKIKIVNWEEYGNRTIDN